MPGWILLGAFAASAAAPPATSTSATAPPEQSQQIIVEGQRNRDRAIHDFVKAVTPARIGGQIARYDGKVCPTAVGLSEAQDLRVTERLRQVASAANIPLDKAGCSPNMLVIVVGDKSDFIAGLRKRYPIYFSGAANSAARLNEPGPATAWHINGSMTPDHLPMSVHSPSSDGTTGNYELSSSMDASRLLPPRIPYFLAGVLVVEARSLAGLSTTQLADYAAMRLYAATNPHQLRPSASSILGILDAPMGSEIPLTMTSWDLSFLKALYRSDDRQFENRQRDEIERMVQRDTSGGPGR